MTAFPAGSAVLLLEQQHGIPRRHIADAFYLTERKHVPLVAGNHDVCTARDGGCQDDVVVRVG